MIVSILLHLVLTVGGVVSNGVQCPMISRTRYKEVRDVGYETCGDGLRMCFHAIRLTEITRNDQYSFLFSAGCINDEVKKMFEVDDAFFVDLCKSEGLSRCTHGHEKGVYAGTLCCAHNAVDMYSSWLWDVFFGSSVELEYELRSTESFMEKAKKGMHETVDLPLGDVVFTISLPFFAIILFTSLALLQYYHINDGIVS
ncbi:unnamed protein product [Caenorhabditis sp. 36 PRJEB53466]|nr:unnamed protein product [Caenorhabditis sp. 36 PRJEB53466]